MRHNAIKTFENKTAVTTRVSLTRPTGEANLHLQVQYSQAGDFSDVEEAILTSVEADRGKVRFFDGEASAAFPAEGLSDDYAGQRVVVDLSAVPLQVWLRYRWYAAIGEPSGAWRGLYHPSSGGVEDVVSAVQANCALVVSLTGTTAGRWSVDNGVTWHESGTALTLAPGSFTVTYQPVAGYVTPAPAAATIVAGQVTTIAGDYVAEVVDPYADWGYLQVTLTGTDAGRWTIDSGDTWHESGVTLYVLAGPYGVQFEPVNGYTTPIEQIVTVSAGQTTSVSAGYVAVDVSRDPADYGMTWDNGYEPSIIDPNKVIYVTPTGAGSKSGDSWANAKAGIYTAMLAANDGDALYLQEGRYTDHLAPIENKSVRVYGGFAAADGSWAARDGWTHKTIINASSNATVPFVKPAAGKTIAVDGLCFESFAAGVVTNNGGAGSVKNCIFDATGGMASAFAASNCLFAEGTGAVKNDAANCVFIGCRNYYDTYIVTGGATNCTFTNCTSKNDIVTGGATDCVITNCTTGGTAGGIVVRGGAADCVITNCTAGGMVVTGGATDCVITNCTAIYIVTGGATDCVITNCKVSGGNDYNNYIVYNGATNCVITNCTTSGGIVYGGVTAYCTFIRCKAPYLQRNFNNPYAVTNCVIFNCDITMIDFGGGTNNAASAYINAETLVLGMGNTLANFTSLGTVTTKGYSAGLNDTPLADFGDFRPQTGSVLIGAGVAVAGITTDITGATRSDPPTIGAYEGVND